MNKDASNKLSAVKFRLVLIASIVILLGLAGVGFWFFCNQLTSYATEVRSANAAASTSTSDILRLKQLEKQLEEDSVAVTRAKNIVADSKYYQYQDQIIADFTSYAKASKLTISSINFDTGAAAPAAPAPGGTPTPAGLKSTTATVTLKNPVNYQALLKFVHSLELNLTKMQLTGITLQRDEESKSVTVNPLTIEVYTR